MTLENGERVILFSAHEGQPTIPFNTSLEVGLAGAEASRKTRGMGTPKENIGEGGHSTKKDDGESVIVANYKGVVMLGHMCYT